MGILQMLEGKDLILATKPFARENPARSMRLTLITSLLLILSFSANFFVSFIGFRFLLSVLTALLMIRMFVIYHDHQHKTILLKSPWVDRFMKLYGLFILSPSSIWKRSHDHHHKHNSKLFRPSIGSYPIVTKQKFRQMSHRERFRYLASRHPVSIIFGYYSMFIQGMCIASFTANFKKHYDSFFALLIHFAISALIIYTMGWLSWLFIIFLPFFISLGIGSYLFYAQHNFPGVVFSDNESWAYEKAAMQSSSYLEMSKPMAWFTANIGYHHIHHLNSKIPFYRLPEAMRAIPELRNCKRTSFKWSDIRACFKLKVWDTEKKQMTGLNDITVRRTKSNEVSFQN